MTSLNALALKATSKRSCKRPKPSATIASNHTHTGMFSQTYLPTAPQHSENAGLCGNFRLADSQRAILLASLTRICKLP